MGDRLLDKVCIVTGAAQGIGSRLRAGDGERGRRRRHHRPEAHRPGEGGGGRHQGARPTGADPESRRHRSRRDDRHGQDRGGGARSRGLPREQRRAHVRPTHRELGRLPRGELHGHHQCVERGGAVPVGAAPRLDRQHLVDGRVPVAAAHDVRRRRRRAAAHDRAAGLRDHQVDGHPPDPPDGAACSGRAGSG